MTDEQQTVEQHLWRLFDSLRGLSSSDDLADTLLWNAVDWRARTTGLPAPEIDVLQHVAQRVRNRNPALDSTLETEQGALRTYTSVQIRHYARTLLRPVHHRDEFPTSASLVKVAEVALTAYERGSRMDALHLYDPACGSATLALDVAEKLANQAGAPVSIMRPGRQLVHRPARPGSRLPRRRRRHLQLVELPRKRRLLWPPVRLHAG